MARNCGQICLGHFIKICSNFLFMQLVDQISRRNWVLIAKIRPNFKEISSLNA